MSETSGHRFVFIDRDGTLIEDVGFVHRVADYARLPGAAEGLHLLRDAGFRLAIVTNQSGIGRGRFSTSDYEVFQQHLIDDFRTRGVKFEATYVCPHLPDAGCSCRKPEPGLLEAAARELDCDLARSWMVGDKPSDMELAARAGCRGVYVLTGHGRSLRSELGRHVGVAEDLLEAARRIVRSES